MAAELPEGLPDVPALRWLTVFFDFPGESFAVGAAFWRSVTGYGLSPTRGAAGEFATLLPPAGDAYLRVQRLASGIGGCHLDLHVDTTTSSLTAAAERAAALGARIRHQDPANLITAESPGGSAATWTSISAARITRGRSPGTSASAPGSSARFRAGPCSPIQPAASTAW